MVVQPELHTHPKFLLLKRRIGEGAAEVLLRLWGHCQQNQRGEFWPGADTEYVAVVCGWNGAPEVLFEALSQKINGRPGWIEVEEGGIRVHDWGATNAGLLHNWRAGQSGGRPKKNPDTASGNAGANPRVSTLKPKGKAIEKREERGESERASTSVEGLPENKNAAHVPSVEEVVAFGQSRLADAIPEGYCREFHAKVSEAHGWIKNDALIDWQGRIVRYWKSDRYVWLKKNGAAAVSDQGIEELTAQLEKEEDGGKRKALRERIRQLENVPRGTK